MCREKAVTEAMELSICVRTLTSYEKRPNQTLSQIGGVTGIEAARFLAPEKVDEVHGR
jgi:hypothetical protein